MKTVKLAGTGYLDDLPTEGNKLGQAFRDLELEAKVMELRPQERHRRPVRRQVLRARRPGHPPAPPRRLVPGRDRRLVLGRPQHQGAGSTATASGSRSSSATRPLHPRAATAAGAEHGGEDRPQPADGARSCAELSQVPGLDARSQLTGTIVVARDIAHAKIKERLDRGEGMPDYFKDHPVYYAGPAKTPEGMPSGSFGPTTAGPDGQLRRPLPVARRLDGDDRQGQPLASR